MDWIVLCESFHLSLRFISHLALITIITGMVPETNQIQNELQSFFSFFYIKRHYEILMLYLYFNCNNYVPFDSHKVYGNRMMCDIMRIRWKNDNFHNKSCLAFIWCIKDN